MLTKFIRLDLVTLPLKAWAYNHLNVVITMYSFIHYKRIEKQTNERKYITYFKVYYYEKLIIKQILGVMNIFFILIVVIDSN